jgi:membrane-associated progesterone receptor component
MFSSIVKVDLDSFSDEVKNPLNIALLVVLLYLLTPVIQAVLPADPHKATPNSHMDGYSWMPAKHPEAIIWREFSPRSLRQYDGTSPDQSKPILFAIRGKVYDVSSGRSFYGPGGPYGECTAL